MPHKLLQVNRFNGNPEFQTQSAILSTCPYDPKVLVIGTYNDGANPNNHADFYYGRNYFWPIIANLARNNIPRIRLRRDHGHLPALEEILTLCRRFRMTFADLIADADIHLPNHDDVHLDRALANGAATGNGNMIAEYIIQTNSITHVYATTLFRNQRQIARIWDGVIQAVNQRRPLPVIGCGLTIV